MMIIIIVIIKPGQCTGRCRVRIKQKIDTYDDKVSSFKYNAQVRLVFDWVQRKKMV